MENSISLLDKLKSGELKLDKKVKKETNASSESRRTYTSLQEIYFKDCPDMVIREDDTQLLKILKRFLYDNNIKYGDVIGKSKISYSTFYFMRDKKKVNADIFERIINICGYEIDDMTYTKIEID